MKILPRALVSRLLLASLLLLPMSLGATAWYLERAHRVALDAAMAERLQLQVLALLAQAEVGDNFELPLLPLEPRLSQANSGLYAAVTNARGELLWLSPSAALLDAPLQALLAGVPTLATGELHDSERDGLLRHSYQVLWEVEPGVELPLRFTVAESTAPRDADARAFQERLWLWLGATLLLLLLVQLLIVRWGLQPLRRLSVAIARIEAGEAARLEGYWPREVRPLVDNLQTLLDGEQRRRERMRNTLADLAHSLKTPLAVLRSADPSAPDYAALQREQLERMEEVVAWQLQRASGGQQHLLQRVHVAPALERLRDTLLKVYAERELEITVRCPQDARFRGDERDLLELLGNLLDNACKYGRRRIDVEVSGGIGGQALRIVVEDDGEGISPELRDALVQRGARADTRGEGQGIGLAMVLEIVRAQGGRLSFADSPLGGARVVVTLS